MNPKQSYVQIHVPLDTSALWYQNLKNALANTHVRWQNDGFHITAAFIEDKLDEKGIIQATRVLDGVSGSVSKAFILFNKLDAFTTNGGQQHVVYLTAPAAYVSLEHVLLVKRVRTALETSGYHLGPYKLHVTLARIPVSEISLQALKETLSTISLPIINSTLTSASYCFLKDHAHPIKGWNFEGEYFSPENRVAEYLDKRFSKDLSSVLKIRRRDGYRLVVFPSQDRDPETIVDEYFQDDLWTKYVFSGVIYFISIAEKAIRDVAGEGFLYDFLRVSRWPFFSAPSETSLFDSAVIARLTGLSSFLRDEAIFAAVSAPVAEVIYKEIELTMMSGKRFRNPHPAPKGLDEAHARLLSVSEKLKRPVLAEYDSLVFGTKV